MPTPANLDVFVEHLQRAGLLVFDPLIEELRNGGAVDNVAERTAQSRFVRAVGLSRRKLKLIERTRHAARLLRDGGAIADVASDTGFYDQPHLTRAVRQLIGYTPSELVRDDTSSSTCDRRFGTRPPPLAVVRFLVVGLLERGRWYKRVRRIINSTYITLDGVIQNPQDWPSVGGWTSQGTQIQIELIKHCDAALMGRRTYESFAPAWSTRSGDPLSDGMNSLPKYVVSTTLTEPKLAQHDGHRPRPNRDRARTQAAARRRHRSIRLRPAIPCAHGRRAARRAAPLGTPILRRHRHH